MSVEQKSAAQLSVGRISGTDPRSADFGAIASDEQLHDAALRAVRQPAGRVAVVLHLSRLAAPGARPHHRRIARALMQDTASRFDGQVFARPSGDLVLLCRVGTGQGRGAAPSGGAAARVTTADPLSLPQVFARLLRADVADPEQLVSVWRLDQQQDLLLAYTALRTRAGAVAPPREDFSGQTSLVDSLSLVVDQVSLNDVVRRQTAICLRDPGAGGGEGFAPQYRDMSFALPTLESRLAEAGQMRIDPFLFRHLSARLDQRMMAAVTASLGRGGPLDATCGASGQMPRMHLSMTVAGVLSQAFAGLAQACRRQPVPAVLGIEINVMEAAADTARFAQARGRLVEAGFAFVIGGVTHLSLLVANPAPWKPDLLKLDWSQRLSELPESDAVAVDAAVAEIGPERIVLQRADSEAALHWGMARGIRRFQGRQVDVMLGAGRMVACSGAAACTLRQCVERAVTVSPSGRAGCSNLALLDHAAPFAMPDAAAGSARVAPFAAPQGAAAKVTA